MEKINSSINLLSVQEVSKITRCQPQTIYSWLHYKQIPQEIYISLGSKKLFLRERLESWLLAGAELKKRVKR